MSETILVLNAGSSSIKFQLFGVVARDGLERRMRGQVEGIGTRPRLMAKGMQGETLVDETWPAREVSHVPIALEKLIAFLREWLPQPGEAAVRRVAAKGKRSRR